MRKISKGCEPEELKKWKSKHPKESYKTLGKSEEGKEVIQAIRKVCLQEQYNLCAYCCERISYEKSLNEHVESQKQSPDKTLDFENIVASCTTNKQCDKSKNTQQLSLTPFMDECATELKFSISGRVEGITERAKETIQVLNLGDKEENNRNLIEKRKQIVSALLWKNGINPEEGLEDDGLLQLVISDLRRPNNQNQFESFAPLAINILKQQLGC